MGSNWRDLIYEGSFLLGTLHLPHSDLFVAPVYGMSDNDRAYLSYEKAKAIGLSYRT